METVRTEGNMNMWDQYGYILVGIGLYGGWAAWHPAIRCIYVLLFPVHAILFEVMKAAAPDVKNVITAQWFRSLLFCFLIWFVLATFSK